MKELLSYLQLMVDCKECKPYDGWTAEDRLEHFINKNGYNPIQLSEKLRRTILSKYLPEGLTERFYADYTDLFPEWVAFTEKLQKHLEQFEHSKLVSRVMFDIYWDMK